VQELAGMRPQDIRNLRTADIDTSGNVWVYRPWTHKNEHHGQILEIALGPKAQSILMPFLKPKSPLLVFYSMFFYVVAL
jgi:integrase